MTKRCVPEAAPTPVRVVTFEWCLRRRSRLFYVFLSNKTSLCVMCIHGRQTDKPPSPEALSFVGVYHNNPARFTGMGNQ